MLGETFVGEVDLENGTHLELVIMPLKGTVLSGRWDTDTDLLLVCNLLERRCCPCHPSDHPNRYIEQLGMLRDDAEHFAKWMQDNC